MAQESKGLTLDQIMALGGKPVSSEPSTPLPSTSSSKGLTYDQVIALGGKPVVEKTPSPSQPSTPAEIRAALERSVQERIAAKASGKVGVPLLPMASPVGAERAIGFAKGQVAGPASLAVGGLNLGRELGITPLQTEKPFEVPAMLQPSTEQQQVGYDVGTTEAAIQGGLAAGRTITNLIAKRVPGIFNRVIGAEKFIDRNINPGRAVQRGFELQGMTPSQQAKAAFFARPTKELLNNVLAPEMEAAGQTITTTLQQAAKEAKQAKQPLPQIQAQLVGSTERVGLTPMAAQARRVKLADEIGGITDPKEVKERLRLIEDLGRDLTKKAGLSPELNTRFEEAVRANQALRDQLDRISRPGWSNRRPLTMAEKTAITVGLPLAGEVAGPIVRKGIEMMIAH